VFDVVSVARGLVVARVLARHGSGTFVARVFVSSDYEASEYTISCLLIASIARYGKTNSFF
jgi:hypothetical protein